MWDNTVLVFMGDNGGPILGAHSNLPYRGGKLNFFEGGIRPPAFMTSPLLSRAVRGQTYKGISHIVDWYTTFVRLAGIAAEHTPRELDGIDMWDHLQNPRAYRENLEVLQVQSELEVNTTLHRHEVLISNHILIHRGWKLVAGPLDLRGGVLGSGGGWVELPKNKSSVCPFDMYTDKLGVGCPNDEHRVLNGGLPVFTKAEKWLCSEACSHDHPCLWNIEKDPEERNEISTEHPKILARMVHLLEGYRRRFKRQTSIKDNGRFCKAAWERASIKGNYCGEDNTEYCEGVMFAGPWIDDTEPEFLDGSVDTLFEPPRPSYSWESDHARMEPDWDFTSLLFKETHRSRKFLGT